MKLTNNFINKANSIHNFEYSYDKVSYVNNKTKVTITCKHHGDFEQLPMNHTNQKQGCPECGKIKKAKSNTLSHEEFIKKAEEVHNSYYSYEYTKYTHSKEKVIITCPTHGNFEQRAGTHLKGHGCTKCWNSRNSNLWSYSDWEKAGQESKNFEGYQLYLLECSSDKEHFLKIGKTFVNISKRYESHRDLPYLYSIADQLFGSASLISELEQYIKTTYEKYTPNKKFSGDKECINIKYKEQIIQLLKEPHVPIIKG